MILRTDLRALRVLDFFQTQSNIALQEAFVLLARTIDALALLEGEQPYKTLADNINHEVRQALASKRPSRTTESET